MSAPAATETHERARNVVLLDNVTLVAALRPFRKRAPRGVRLDVTSSVPLPLVTSNRLRLTIYWKSVRMAACVHRRGFLASTCNRDARFRL